MEGGVSYEDLVDFSDATKFPTTANAAVLSELARKTRSRSLAIPTDDIKVRLRLRELDEPLTLFGEVPADRRDRLRFVLSLEIQKKPDDSDEEMYEEVTDSDQDDSEDEEFFTHGSEELLESRRQISIESLHRYQQNNFTIRNA
ncbi:hypothetical protein HK098_003621 [Nowakowskiella sp. JEL0407]|nr:hypothetical protein HK098_003621 [Nowakowskiella sp. JEL0407]